MNKVITKELIFFGFLLLKIVITTPSQKLFIFLHHEYPNKEYKRPCTGSITNGGQSFRERYGPTSHYSQCLFTYRK